MFWVCFSVNLKIGRSIFYSKTKNWVGFGVPLELIANSILGFSVLSEMVLDLSFAVSCNVLFLCIAIKEPCVLQEEQSPNSHNNETYGDEAGQVEELQQVFFFLPSIRVFG